MRIGGKIAPSSVSNEGLHGTAHSLGSFAAREALRYAVSAYRPSWGVIQLTFSVYSHFPLWFNERNVILGSYEETIELLVRWRIYF